MKILILICISFLMILTGCNTVSDEVIGLGSTDPPDSTGFYSTTAAGVTLEYRVDNDMLHCIIRAETSGWVAVGFNPTNVMQDANFIIGYVNGINTEVRDDWGISPAAHVSDESLGGANNVEIVSGLQMAGVTEIEFKIPLDSGDQYDQVLQVGESYPILLAKGNSDDYNSYHSDAGFSTITVQK